MLYVPRGHGCARQVSSEGTTQPVAAFGTVVTPSTGGYGSDASVLVLDEDAHELEVRVSNTAADSASREIAVEVRVDRSGGTSYSTLVPGLICGGAGGYTVNPRRYMLPLFVPAGSRLAARAYGSVTTACRVVLLARSRPQRAEVWRAGHVVEAIGLSGTAGQAITPGTTTKGSRVLLGTTTRALWHWQIAVQIAAADTNWTNNLLHYDLEYSLDGGTTFHRLLTDELVATNSGEMLFAWPSITHVHVPAGAQIYARAQMSGGTADAQTAVAYGVG